MTCHTPIDEIRIDFECPRKRKEIVEDANDRFSATKTCLYNINLKIPVPKLAVT